MKKVVGFVLLLQLLLIFNFNITTVTARKRRINSRKLLNSKRKKNLSRSRNNDRKPRNGPKIFKYNPAFVTKKICRDEVDSTNVCFVPASCKRYNVEDVDDTIEWQDDSSFTNIMDMLLRKSNNKYSIEKPPKTQKFRFLCHCQMYYDHLMDSRAKIDEAESKSKSYAPKMVQKIASVGSGTSGSYKEKFLSNEICAESDILPQKTYRDYKHFQLERCRAQRDLKILCYSDCENCEVVKKKKIKSAVESYKETIDEYEDSRTGNENITMLFMDMTDGKAQEFLQRREEMSEKKVMLEHLERVERNFGSSEHPPLKIQEDGQTIAYHGEAMVMLPCFFYPPTAASHSTVTWYKQTDINSDSENL